MKTRELSLAVVGIDYPNPDGSNRRFEIALLTPGEEVALVREPTNEADAHAVGVFSSRGIRIGYLTAERAPWIGGRLANGEPVTAVFQCLQGSAAWVRAAFGDQPPALPSSSQPLGGRPDAGSDWQPDPDGPEWGA